jgi:hypothetical protein
MGDPAEPIDPYWVGITHARAWNRESFHLCFYKFDGTLITLEFFETLEIALDQADDIAGIEKADWESCEVDVTDPEGRVPWNHVP